MTITLAKKREIANCSPMIPEPDPLTEVLEAFPLNIGFAGRLDLTAPWGLSIPDGLGVVCAVQHAPCLLNIGGDDHSTIAGPGDVLLLSPACGHVLRDSPTSPVVPVEELISRSQAARALDSFGAGGARTTLLGSVFRYDDARTHPLRAALPPVIHLKNRDDEPAAALDEVIRLMRREASAPQPGGRGILHRLAEILFLQAVRAALAEAGGSGERPIRGMLHPEIAAALALIHRHPERPWTVARLADHVAMSRSAFSATFVRVLGKPPLQYVRERRMRLACRLLRDPSLGLSDIASRVGYDSVSAFSTAFKRYSGASPGGYRHRDAVELT